MDILDFAMQMELDGRKFYLAGADQTQEEHLKEIYLKLAEEEHRHYNVFKRLKEGDIEAAEGAMKSQDETILLTKNLFKEMAEKGLKGLPGESEKEIWTEAREVEEKSVKMYSEEAEKQSDPAKKELLTRLADEERTHIYLIENILTFLKDPSGFQKTQDYKNFMSWEGRGGPGF